MISVSIVTYNNSFSEVKACLRNFIDLKEIEQVVICENTEVPILNEGELTYYNRKIRYISNIKNTGYGSGHNLAFYSIQTETAQEYHVVMNLDVIANKDVFLTIKKLMDSNSDIVHVMPKVLNLDGTVQRLCKRLPNPLDLVIRRFFPKIEALKKYDDAYMLNNYNYDHILNCPYLSGCFMFLRTDSYKQVSGFDERFFLYPEDIDLTRRLHDIGRTVCYPNVSICHEHSRASYSSFKMLAFHIVGMIKYFNKWGWFFDRKRKKYNMELQKNITSPPTR